MAKLNISSLLKGETPRLIDEWQEAPKFWDAIRAKVDEAQDAGQYILTGSSVHPKQTKSFIPEQGGSPA